MKEAFELVNKEMYFVDFCNLISKITDKSLGEVYNNYLAQGVSDGKESNVERLTQCELQGIEENLQA
jgi:hypothetical protein